ncbi:MAG TPA: hypothetical protein VE360_05110 [Pyrinomonadaceae bacterium]|nr:hypothetical protein [Pyrinomonadaceae bacterium]
MRKQFLSAAAFACTVLAACACAAAQQTAAPSPSPMPSPAPSASPEQLRAVKGQVLISPALPAAAVEFDKDFKYVGGHSFILYDVARAEQHFFVDADSDGRVKRFYWVQFEGYLPSNTHAYDYKQKVPKTVNIGGLEFIADAYPRNIKTNPGRPDSDGARARAFLESKGYRMAGDDILMQRLVHLVDVARRNELMVIYIEDLGGMGLTAADFAEGGRAAARWPEISKGLLERAVGGMKISR